MTEFDVSNKNKKYKVERIQDNIVYTKESENGHLPKLYYLVFQKGYPEKENT